MLACLGSLSCKMCIASTSISPFCFIFSTFSSKFSAKMHRYFSPVNAPSILTRSVTPKAQTPAHTLIFSPLPCFLVCFVHSGLYMDFFPHFTKGVLPQSFPQRLIILSSRNITPSQSKASHFSYFLAKAKRFCAVAWVI